MQIVKEQIADLKKKLIELEGAKNVAEWARDEALRAKEEAVFVRAEAECSKEKAKEEAVFARAEAEWLRPRPSSKLKFMGYAGFIVPRSGMRTSSRLGLKPHSTCGRWSTCTIPYH